MKEDKYILEENIESSTGLTEELVYSQILKDVLVLRDEVTNVASRTHVLLAVVIENIREINRSSNNMDEIALMHAVSHTLFKILAPLDIYYIDDENFLFILDNTNKKKIDTSMKLAKKMLHKLFKQEVSIIWQVMKTAKDLDTLKPFLSGIKMDFFRARQGSNSCIRKRSKKLSFRSMFKNFSIAYLVFFNIFLIAGIFMYVTGQNLYFIPSSQGFTAMGSGMDAWFLNTLHMSAASFVFLVFIGMTFSALFGLFGMLLGWIMNVESRVSETSNKELVLNKT
jgi:hypothetical protein